MVERIRRPYDGTRKKFKTKFGITDKFLIEIGPRQGPILLKQL